MKKYNRALALFIVFCIVLILSSCSSLEITEEVEVAMNIYTSAVEATIENTSGNISVVSVTNDNAIEFKTTESKIDYSYEIKDGSVCFERTDYLNGEENAKYTCDGSTVLIYDYKSNDWIDKTEENETFIAPDKNPFVTLSLFRVDNKLKIRSDYMTSIRSYKTEDGLTAIEFTLKDSTVSDVLAYYKADGIVRQSAGHTRTYYVDENGKISKIIISTIQKMTSNGKEGDYTTNITVTLN